MQLNYEICIENVKNSRSIEANEKEAFLKNLTELNKAVQHHKAQREAHETFSSYVREVL